MNLTRSPSCLGHARYARKPLRAVHPKPVKATHPSVTVMPRSCSLRSQAASRRSSQTRQSPSLVSPPDLTRSGRYPRPPRPTKRGPHALRALPAPSAPQSTQTSSPWLNRRTRWPASRGSSLRYRSAPRKFVRARCAPGIPHANCPRGGSGLEHNTNYQTLQIPHHLLTLS